MRLTPFLLLCACAHGEPPATTPETDEPYHVRPEKQCPVGSYTYLGFEGTGEPSRALVDAVHEQFPDAIVVLVKDGKLGIITREPHSMDVRHRHEAAAAAVRWLGNVVDFAQVNAHCEMTFAHKF